MATIEKYQTSTGVTRYMVRYRTPQHTQTKKRGFTTKRAAEAFANTVEVEKLTGNYVAPSLGQVTMGELGKEWLARQAHHKASWSARLESVWRVHVEPKWGRRRIADIRPTEVQKWVAELKLSPSSVAHAHTVLAGILDGAVADRRLGANPARGVKLPRKTPKVRNYLTAKQASALADESKYPDIVLLLATTGLRWGEMAALRVRDVDLGRSRIRIERSASKVNSKSIIGTTKTHTARSVAVSASVLKLLAPAMVGKSPDELLWSRADGRPLRPPTTTHWFGAAIKRCQAADDKFPRVTVHDLRHTAASLMIASGANVKTVQSQLGHKTATMTLDLYGHLFPDDLDDIANKMDDLVSGCAQNVPKKEAGQG
ncbi:tyrosine-type recombinase/integrase [Mycolicibacterium tusciae]|uniref:tyrosine-type recombinase/integrase n=1 Tax=Mycolicibacterium tusciae TaxID=75922 RepID=UPI00024A2A73|nr:site-specific integrase [Mycolicibacterium tusciae]